jgi:UDP:flavonoid glycosyltransferase YjiC (YdhE family)
VGDETYELITAYKRGKARKPLPFVMIYDFIGMDAVGWNPLERLGTYLWNRSWSRGGKSASAISAIVDLSLFIGEEEDVPDRPFGPFLPNRREWARRRCEFVGYVLSFDPREHQDRRALREQLGYDADHPLVVCSIGGTAVGKGLLELCGKAYSAMADRIPDLQMVLVAGPRLDPDTLDVPNGIIRKGYVPRLYEHLATSDLAVVQGGGTVTLELTALGRPFIYFPIPGHCEQQVHVAGRLRRHGAGVQMDSLNTSPDALAEAMVRNLGGEVETGHVPVEGARVAAEKISRLL